jgi:hypothetical protein
MMLLKKSSTPAMDSTVTTGFGSKSATVSSLPKASVGV